MKLPRRRQFLQLAAGAAALPAVSPIAWAQCYPARPVRLSSVSHPAGRTILTRASSANGCRSGSASLSSSTTDRRQRQYRQGVGRAITARRLYAGHGAPSSTINETLLRQASFLFLRDIAPVASIGRNVLVMVVHPSIPVKTVPELIAYAKGNPNKLNMASPGSGTGRIWRASCSR